MKRPCGVTHKFLDIRPKEVPMVRQYACEISIQYDDKFDFVSDAQSLCGVALNISSYIRFYSTIYRQPNYLCLCVKVEELDLNAVIYNF